MKIIVLTTNLFEKSGWGRHSSGVITGLREKGLDVIVVCNEVSLEHKDIKQIAILPGPNNFKLNYFFSLWYVFKILKHRHVLRDVDLVHCLVEPYAYISFLLARILKAKLFLTVHGSYGVKTLVNFLYRCLQLRAYKYARKIICVSNYTKKVMHTRAKLDNLEVVNIGIEKEYLPQTTQAGEKKVAIVSVGALKIRKGFHFSLKAFAEAKKKFPNLKYYIVGDQSDKKYFSALKELAEKEAVEQDVIFLENISNQELGQIYNKSKIFILTSISDPYNFEGFGLVYLEANAHGLPAIGFLGSGAEDAIKDGVTGFLAESEDYKMAADKIKQLLSDEQLYAQMSGEAAGWAKDHIWSNQLDKYLELYKL